MFNDEKQLYSQCKSHIHLLNNASQNINEAYTNVMNSVLINDSTFKMKLSDIFEIKDETFLKEKEKLKLAYSTEVEYKDKNKFDKYKLEIKENRLLILKYFYLKQHYNNNNKTTLITNHFCPQKDFVLLNSYTNHTHTNSYNNCNSNINININTNTNSHTNITRIKEVNYISPILVLDFDYITSSMMLIREKMEIRLYVLGSNKVFRIRVNNKEIYNRLANSISIAIATSKGSKANLISISLRNYWYKNYFISQEQFAIKAKTGDILLFRGMECPATFQRLLTYDEYDHVVFLQKKQATLFLFEATSKDGCKLRHWAEFTGLLWNLVHEKIVYRELIINSLNKDKIQRLLETKAEEFISKTNMKKYDISICTIICGGKKRKHEEMNEWNKSKGFSCSSLVSAAYLYMGVIPYIKETRTVIPGQFSTKVKMKFNQPFELGPEVVLDFSK